MRRHGLGALIIGTVCIVLVGSSGQAFGEITATGSYWPNPIPSNGVITGELQLGVSFNTSGTLTVTEGDTLETQDRSFLAYTVGATGNVYVTDSFWQPSSAVFMASQSYSHATVHLTNSIWSVESNTALSQGDDSEASIILDAGSSWTTLFGVKMAAGDDSTATVDLNDGTWTAQSGVNVSMDGFWDSLGTGTININSSGFMDSEYSLTVGTNGVVAFDGGELRLAGETNFDGAVHATSNGGTIRVMAGQVAGGTGLVKVSGGVDFTNADIYIEFHDGSEPAPSETIDLFDPIGAVDLATILDSANLISPPEDWVLDHETGILHFVPFAVCMEGPGVVASPGCQTAYDSDSDSDVDLVDFASFQIAFPG
ncbi:MAG: hypothetical protein GY842_18125 [bacterium]|nr:hypothetical protein [bacterium]